MTTYLRWAFAAEIADQDRFARPLSRGMMMEIILAVLKNFLCLGSSNLVRPPSQFLEYAL